MEPKITEVSNEPKIESGHVKKVTYSNDRHSKIIYGGFFILIIISVGLLGGLFLYSSNKLLFTPSRAELHFTLYSSPYCGCCHQYIAYLEDLNVNVTHIKINNSEILKDEYQIPENLRSCHTIFVSNYIVEGHVPIEAIDQLLNEKPNIDGIALAGMPSGAPGISGEKESKFDIIAFSDGESVGLFSSI
ncbi:MAG: DUF411 domain-containing protein [Candidatus Hodarchaeales archaeon]